MHTCPRRYPAAVENARNSAADQDFRNDNLTRPVRVFRAQIKSEAAADPNPVAEAALLLVGDADQLPSVGPG